MVLIYLIGSRITEVQELNSNLGWGIFIISPTNILWEILLTLTFVKLLETFTVFTLLSLRQ